jgi:hypothetical protein
LQFEKDRPPSFKASLNVFLRFHNDFNSFLGFPGLGLGFSFLRFLGLGLGLGLGLNKMDLAYVCMSSIIQNFILYISFTYRYVSRIIFHMVLNT